MIKNLLNPLFRITFLLAALVYFTNETHGQCANNNSYWMDLTPAGVGFTATTTCIFGGEYVTLQACAGAQYTLSTCATTWDTQITIYASTGGASVGYNDDGCAPGSYLVWIAPTTATYYVLVDEYNCVDYDACGTLSITQDTACAGVGGCGNDNVLWINLTPGGAGQSATTTVMYGGEYCTVTVCEGANYTFSACANSYDTELTLYSSGGTFLDYDDDGCGIFAGASTISWTATFSGVVWILLDQYPCTSNITNSTLTVTQNTACGGADCVLYEVYGDFISCDLTDEYWNFQVDYDGPCLVEGMWVYTDANGWEYVDLTSFGYGSLDLIEIWFLIDYTYYEFYFVLSDGTESDNYAITTVGCDDVGLCTNLDSDAFYDGCEFSNTTQQLEELVSFYFYYTGNCLVDGIYLAAEGSAFTYYDLSADGLFSGDFSQFYLFNDFTWYDYYFVLSDGSTSSIFSYFTGSCNSLCSNLDSDAFYAGCEFSNTTQQLEELVDFYFYYTGSCSVEGIYISADGGPFDYFDLSADGLFSGDFTGFYLFADFTLYDYYFVLNDGTVSSFFSYLTGSCDGGGCTNLYSFTFDSGCLDYEGTLTPSLDILFDYDGDCEVSQLCIGLEGDLLDCYDLSGAGYNSGDFFGFYLFETDSWYQFYYTLDDGSTSSYFYYFNGNCNENIYICDCAGTVHDAGVLAWLGDDFADDGTYLYNDQPVDFNCATWGFDCGDIDLGGITYDPYAVCSGNLPPANGCVIDEPCNLVDIVVATDCYPEETTVYLFDENGNVVFYAGGEVFMDEYTEYTITMCLPYGCYVFAIYDEFGDGLSAIQCTQDGYYYVTDYGDLYLDGPSDFGYEFFQEFCVGPVQTCSNLSLDLYQEPCVDSENGLVPIIGMTFDFDGDCMVEQVCISAEGAPFVCTDVTDFEWFNGDQGFITNTQPDVLYSLYYILDDGSISSVFYWENGNCENEITICDCAGTQLSIGVLEWLGDGFADNGFYQWEGQDVDFNCATWGYDCGDIDGAPDFDPYGVCVGGLPPANGCDLEEEVLGCTDPEAINYDSDATINDGSCIYDLAEGCTDEDACNYNADAIFDNGTCEYVTCAGCTDPDANNYDPNATIDDDSCIYEEIEGCTDEDALNYNPIATQDDGSCIFECVWPDIFYDAYCELGNTDEFYISVDVNDLGNGDPYTLTNSYDDTQLTLNFNGVIELGPYPNGQQVLIQVVSNTLDGCFITSSLLTEDCTDGVISGCMDELATNYNAIATEDDGSCQYNFWLCDCDNQVFSPADRFMLGDGDPDNGSGDEPNFNCAAWGYDCGDISGSPTDDPYNVCDGSLPDELIATATGCPLSILENDDQLMAIFPNPNNGVFNLLNGSNYSNLAVSVIDNAGKVVFVSDITLPQRGQRKFDLSQLSQGVYAIEITAGDVRVHKRLIIQK